MAPKSHRDWAKLGQVDTTKVQRFHSLVSRRAQPQELLPTTDRYEEDISLLIPTII